MSKIVATLGESDNSSLGVEGNKDGADAATQTADKSSYIPDILNSVDELTHRPSSEKSSMSEINQPIVGGLETLPQKTTTQHSQTSGDSPDVEGADDDPRGGNDDQDEEVGEEEEEEVEEPSVFDDIPDVDEEEEIKDQDDNGEGGQGEINEGQHQGQTPATPTTEVTPEGIKASTRATWGSLFRGISSS
ncbi:uncharacterized protein LOC127093918 [Lathyrus oleraceus]|uniref:uncharacterized protein LOC127093918 n=1 Tax=Pisum sativum TaxID=3888 RepID=UPI0021CE71CA|nr:uncharacterized protein LOC127093918 [Pisum sativum]